MKTSSIGVFAITLVASATFLVGCGGSAKTAGPPLSADATAGKDFASRSCEGCHTINGSGSSGPTWKGLSGSMVKLSDGTSVVADDAYLTKSILTPDAQTVSGFPKTMTFSFPPGSVSADQARQLVAYIDTLT